MTICPYCHDDLGGRTWTCPRCQTLIHEECHELHGGCVVHGCSVLRWRDVKGRAEELRAAGILNGCGGKGSWVPVPDFMFSASCDHHDFNYWLGGSEADRVKADWQFFEAMVQDAGREPWWRRWWARRAAALYHWAVRRYAGRYFHPVRRTFADLERELLEA